MTRTLSNNLPNKLQSTFIPYGHQSINEEDIQAVASALKGDLITRGSKTEEFEKALASYVGAEYAVAFTSGSTALQGAYWAAECGPYDKVLTTPNTFIATTAFASMRGASIVFVDIDRSSGNLNIEQALLKGEFSSTGGRLFIAPVHFAGIAIDMKKLTQGTKGFNTVVIEDAAHAIGSYYPDGKKVGSCTYSDMTIFSFHPVKQMTTGEGGAVTTNDKALYERLKTFRNSGIVREGPSLKGEKAPWYYEVQELSGNYNFTEFQAALGLSQLKRLDTFIAKRRKLVARYRKNLADLPFIKFFDPGYDGNTSYHLFVAQIDFDSLGTSRTEVMEALKEKGIGTQFHYIPLYRHPPYRKKMGDIEEFFPEMEAYYRQALSLPLYNDLSLEQVDFVTDSLKNVISAVRQD